MIYNTVLMLQVAAVFVCFASTVLLGFKKANSFSNMMLLAFVGGLLQNIGYLFELQAHDVDSVMTAVKVQYLGGAFIISLITFFVFKYSRYDVPVFIKSILLGMGVLVNLGVWSWEKNGMYYTSAEFIDELPIPHIQMGHGWLYFLYSFMIVSELIICIFVCLFNVFKVKEKNMKRNYIILLGVCGVPLVGYIVGVMGSVPGYDTTPISVSFGIALFAIAIARNHVFDIADAASESIINNLDDAIIVVNNENGYEYSNYKAKELFPDLFDIKEGGIIKDEDILSLFSYDRSGEVVFNDRIYDVHVTKVMCEGAEIGKTAALFDVTENRKRLEKMRELMNAADQANIAKSMFIANVSHEIRTPINVILGMGEVLYRDHRNPETDEFVINIRNSAGTLLSLINDILDFSKLESGKMDIVEERYDSKALLQEIIDVYKFRCEKKGIRFEAFIPESLPRYMYGDVVRIKQILNNLLSNAVKYTESGMVIFKLSVKERSNYELDIVAVVEDTGIGIRREEQGKIFQDFSRLDFKHTNTIQGVGLGLTITKQLVKLMHGAVNFRSEYGKGSLFTVVIPQRVDINSDEQVGDISASQDNKKVFNTNFTAKEASILVVDDSVTNLVVVKQLLKHTLVNITTATGGQECLDLCAENQYDMIFLDHRMPMMDGVETFEKLREMNTVNNHIPVIMLTANAVGDARQYYLNKNFTDFLSKPITSEQLIEILEKYLPEEKIEYNK